MCLEDAMVFALATAGHGMTTARLAEVINREKLHTRADGKAVTEQQIHAVVCRFPTTFVKEDGRILLGF